MKVLIGAAAAAMVLAASPAFAQTALSANCSGFAAAPTLPDGAHATRDAMTAAGTQVDAWRLAGEQKQAACQTDINALRAQLEAMIAAYNAAGQDRVTTVNAWNTEVEEFTARSGTGRREHGSSLTRPDHD